MATCSDWCHLFRCPKSWAFVHQFGDISDNWYRTKADFSHRAKALNLTDEQQVKFLGLCLYGNAKKSFTNIVRATNFQISFDTLINVLDKKFNKNHSTKMKKFLDLHIRAHESTEDFLCRVIDEGNNLYLLDSGSKLTIIGETFAAGVGNRELSYILLPQLAGRFKNPPTIEELFSLCYKHSVDTPSRKPSKCHICASIITKVGSECRPADEESNIQTPESRFSTPQSAGSTQHCNPATEIPATSDGTTEADGMNRSCPSAPPCSATGEQVHPTSKVSSEEKIAASLHQDAMTATPNLHSSSKASDKVFNVCNHPVAAAIYLLIYMLFSTLQCLVSTITSIYFGTTFILKLGKDIYSSGRVKCQTQGHNGVLLLGNYKLIFPKLSKPKSGSHIKYIYRLANKLLRYFSQAIVKLDPLPPGSLHNTNILAQIQALST